MAARNNFGPHWPRWRMWCLLGTTVMFGWLMAPVAKCSFIAFRDTPLSESQPSLAPGETDANRVDQSQGFVEKLTTATKVCYARTPLLGQEDWKGYLLIGFAAGTALTWALMIWDSRRAKTFGS